MSDQAVRLLVEFIRAVQPLFLLYFVLYNSYTLWLILLSARQVRRRVAGHFIEDLDLIDERDLTKPLTMIVPAYNEEVTIRESVRSFLTLRYPNLEVVVCNDGSRDTTLDVLRETFDLVPVNPIFRRSVET